MATSFKQIKNNAKSIVNLNALNNTTISLSFDVEDGSKFPLPGNGFYVTVWNNSKYFDPSDDPNMRIGLCTARTSNTLTVTWGQEGTPINVIKGRPIVALLVLGKNLQDAYDAINNVEGTYAVDSNVVHKNGTETIPGQKTFNSQVNINAGIPTLDLKTTQGALKEWKFAAGYNDPNSLSIVDVNNSNAQRLRIDDNGDITISAKLRGISPGLASTDAINLLQLNNALAALNFSGIYRITNPTDAIYGATGNGTTDDTAALQAAITAMPSGTKMVIPNGTYKITSRLNITKSNVEIELAPGAVLKAFATLSPNGSRNNYKGLFHIAGTTSIDSVYIHGGTIDLNSQPDSNAISIWGSGSDPSVYTTSNVIIDGVKMINKAGSTNALEFLTIYTGNVNGQAVGRVQNVYVRNCKFNNSDARCITYIGDWLRNWYVFSNEFSNSQLDTIVQGCYLQDTSDNFVFYNNTYVHTKLGGAGGSICDYTDANKAGGSRLLFTDNLFSNTGDTFIYPDRPCINIHGWHDVKVKGNTFRDTVEALSFGQSIGGTAWLIKGCEDVMVEENTFLNVETLIDNDSTYRVLWKNNIFRDVGFRAIGCYSAREYTIIEGNLFYNCNNVVEDPIKLVKHGYTTTTVPAYDYSVIESGGQDRMVIKNNTFVDDRLLKNPGTTGNSTFAQASGGSLPARTYYVRYSYMNITGETLASTEETYSVSANNLMTLTPGLPSGYASTYSTIGGIRGINVYVSTSTGTETLQFTIPYPNTKISWTEPTTGLVTGRALPTSNTTHTLTRYAYYSLTGYIGSGNNVVSNNLIYGIGTSVNGIVTPFSSNSPSTDKTIFLSNLSEDILLPDIITRQFIQGNITGATTFSRVNGSVITGTLTGNVTATISSGTIAGDMLTLVLTQDATGSRVITWPSNFKKVGGSLLLSTAPNATDRVTMSWDGTNWNETSRSLSLS